MKMMNINRTHDGKCGKIKTKNHRRAHPLRDVKSIKKMFMSLLNKVYYLHSYVRFYVSFFDSRSRHRVNYNLNFTWIHIVTEFPFKNFRSRPKSFYFGFFETFFLFFLTSIVQLNKKCKKSKSDITYLFLCVPYYYPSSLPLLCSYFFIDNIIGRWWYS